MMAAAMKTIVIARRPASTLSESPQRKEVSLVCASHEPFRLLLIRRKLVMRGRQMQPNTNLVLISIQLGHVLPHILCVPSPLAAFASKFFPTKKAGCCWLFHLAGGELVAGGSNHTSGAETPRTLHNWQLFTGRSGRRVCRTHRLHPITMPYLQDWTCPGKGGSLSTAKIVLLLSFLRNPQSAPCANSLSPTP